MMNDPQERNECQTILVRMNAYVHIHPFVLICTDITEGIGSFDTYTLNTVVIEGKIGIIYNFPWSI